MSYTPETLDALIAAIDSGDVGALDRLPIDGKLPEGAAGQIMLAARACRRLREAATDAIAAACEGRFDEARELAGTAAGDLAVMRKRLDTAASLEAQAQQDAILAQMWDEAGQKWDETGEDEAR